MNGKDPQDFSYQIAVVLDVKTEERQQILEEVDLKIRLKKEVDYINREIKILEIEKNISTLMKDEFQFEILKLFENRLQMEQLSNFGQTQKYLKFQQHLIIKL